MQATFPTALPTTTNTTTAIRFTLKDFLAEDIGTAVLWFDQFKFMSVELWLYGVEESADKPQAKRTSGVAVCADIDGSSALLTTELLRQASARVVSVDFSRGPIFMAKCKPTFDQTGSENHYVNDWLSLISAVAQSAKWYGFTLGTPDPTSAGDTLLLLIKAKIAFRGMQ